jgi:hypothetical protein
MVVSGIDMRVVAIQQRPKLGRLGGLKNYLAMSPETKQNNLRFEMPVGM